MDTAAAKRTEPRTGLHRCNDRTSLGRNLISGFMTNCETYTVRPSRLPQEYAQACALTAPY
jgi:hypothetical protein